MDEPKKRKKTPRNSAKTCKRTIEATVKAAKAVELRCEGKTFEEIRVELGYRSKQTAHAAVTKALRTALREPAEELIVLELSRLDQMWQVAYLNACGGDVNAIGACMRMMDRRAKLLGLDAPVKQPEQKQEEDAPPIIYEIVEVNGEDKA